jgi:anti-sigma B factor antagonist
MGGLLIIKETPTDRHTVLRLSGLFEGYAVQRAQEQLLRYVGDRDSELILDFSSIRYVDSSGIGTLVQMAKAAQGRGLTLALYAVDDQVRRLLLMTGLERVFVFYDRLPFEGGAPAPASASA